MKIAFGVFLSLVFLSPASFAKLSTTSCGHLIKGVSAEKGSENIAFQKADGEWIVLNTKTDSASVEVLKMAYVGKKTVCIETGSIVGAEIGKNRYWTYYLSDLK